MYDQNRWISEVESSELTWNDFYMYNLKMNNLFVSLIMFGPSPLKNSCYTTARYNNPKKVSFKIKSLLIT